MSDCGVLSESGDQAIANFCTDTYRELDNLTEELKHTDTDLASVNTNILKLNENNQNCDVESQRRFFDVDENAQHGLIEEYASPSYTHLNQAIESRYSGDVMFPTWVGQHVDVQLNENHNNMSTEDQCDGEVREADELDGSDMLRSVNLNGNSFLHFCKYYRL